MSGCGQPVACEWEPDRGKRGGCFEHRRAQGTLGRGQHGAEELSRLRRALWLHGHPGYLLVRGSKSQQQGDRGFADALYRLPVSALPGACRRRTRSSTSEREESHRKTCKLIIERRVSP